MAELSSRQIGKYQIQAELGRGGFGVVYRAYDPTVGRLVALKVLTASGDQQLLTRFKNEAASAGNLRHKNIVTIYDFGEHEGLPYIVMEFLEGEDLQQIINEKKPLTLLQKVSIMLQVADGLHCAHRSGVVHRDVKPGNIRLLPDGTVKIMDFGIARLVAGGSSAARLTRQGHVIGTLLYMAPEQVRGGEVDFLCDIFAYGITYYELLAGKHPFQGSDPRAVFYRITTEDPESIRNLVPDCPETLETILNRTLHKERELRYQSLREVQLDTEPILTELRQERATTLLAEANRLYSGGQLDGAQAVLSEAFDLDPGNRGGRQLRETIQNQLLRRVIEPKIEALLKKGERLMTERQFPQAMETFEAALRLDRENAEIKEHLDRARQMINVSKETARMIADARREFSRNNLESVLQTLPETIELDPGNPEARQLLGEVRQELERREKDREREKRLQQARQLLMADRFDDAQAQLDALDADVREREEVQKLIAQINEKRQVVAQQKKFREELAVARELMASDQHEAAIHRLEYLMNKYPEEPEATKLFIIAHKKLAVQRKGEALENLGNDVARLLEGRQFERAFELVNEALRDYPAEQRLVEAIRHIEAEQENYRRSEAVREALAASAECIAQGLPDAAARLLEAAISRHPGEEQLIDALSGVRLALDKKRRDEAIEGVCDAARSRQKDLRFDAALADIGGAVEAYGQDPRLTAARAGIVHAKALWERAEAIKLALKESQQRLTAKHPEQAVEGLEGVLGLYPGDEQLTAGLQLARQALEAKQREDAISEVSRVAGLQLANRDYRLALTSVEEGLAAFGPEDRLTALRAEILEASAAWDRSEAIRAALEQSSQSLKEGEPETAVAVLEAALRCYPDENRLSGALSLGREAVAARRREAAIDELYGQAEIRLRNREFDEAMQIVENGVGTLGEHVRLTALKDRILAAKADWARTESCRTAIENARQHLASDDPESAVQLLEAVLRQYPEEEQLTGAVASARLALEAKRKEEAIQAALRVAGTHLEQQRFDRALTVIDEVVQVRGEDARLMDLRDRVANAKADWVRSEQIGIAIRDSEEQIANGDPERAVAVLDAALAHYPDEEQLLIAAAGARQALDALRRETAIEILCRDIAAQLDRLEFDEALQGVELGLQNFGKEERLAALKAAIVARRIEWHRAETVRTALEQSRQCLAKDDPESAIQALDAARLRYPDEAALEEAIVGARQAVESKRRDLAIEDSCREARLRLERHEFDSAIAEIDRALEEHGADARLTSLRDRICSAEAAWKCEEAIARAIAEANRCLSENDPEGAVQVLEPAIARYADDERLSSAAVSARQAVESKRRDAEVDAICRSAAVKAEGSQFDAALDEIAGAIQNYGADQRLVALQQKIEIAKARYQRREAIRSVLEACEQHLSKGAADQALRLCEQALERYPGDRQLLDAAAGARQAIDVERRAAVEKLTREIRQYLKKHQFERAASAVSLALRRYPGEPALTQLEVKVAEAAQSWEREQSVRRALSQAAELQGRNHFSDALQVLKKALDDNPGEPRLATAYQEIEADYRRQQDEEALGAALEQANLLMDTDPEEVVRLLEAASKNHPTDQRVIAALAAARECREVRRRERSIEAVCRETQVYLYSREFAPALDTIEKGLQTFGEEERLAKMRETVLASKADWERAEGVLRAVEEADRYAAQGQLQEAVDSLLSATRVFGTEDRLTAALTAATEAVEKKRRQDAIDQICRDAQAKLESQEIDGAMLILDQGEQTYGAAPEFQTVRRRVISAKAEAERAETVRRTVADADEMVARGTPEPAIALIDAALARYAGEPALLRARSRVVQAIDARRTDEAIAKVSDEVRALLNRKEFKAAQKKINQAKRAHGPDRRLEQLDAELAGAKTLSPDRQSGAQPRGPGRNPWVLRGAAAVLLVTAFGAALLNRYLRTAKTVHLRVQTSPANASVRIEDRSCTSGDCRFDLKAGVYRIQVSADGYESKTEETRLKPGGTDPTVTIGLRPINPTIQVTANFVQGQVSLDGAIRGSLQDGQFVLDGVQPGRHELKVSGSDGAAVLSFETQFATLAALGAISADGVDAIALGSFGDKAAFSCAGCSAEIFVDERLVGDLKQGTITIDSLSAGTHQLRLKSESGERSMVFKVGPAPAINLAITSNRNYGTLVVETGEDGVSVFLDDVKTPRRTLRGQLRLPVEAREHTVRVAKDGYRVEPAEFRAVVTKGEQLQARFRLVAETARLVVSNGLPGATVSIDGRNVGNISADGSFSATITAGDHQVQFARDGYASARTRKGFAAGSTVHLGRGESQLTPVAPGKAASKAAQNAAPPEPAAPDPAALESAEWQRVARNPTTADIEEFLRKHPSGKNADEAQSLLDRLDWEATNRSSRTALQAFLRKHPGGANASQATADLARLDSEAAGKLQSQQEAERLRLEREGVREVLRSYGDAFAGKDLNQIVALWPTMPAKDLKDIRASFRDFRSLKLELRPLAEPEITGATARVSCTRTTVAVDGSGAHPMQGTVTVQLAKRNGRWVIDSIQ